MRVRAVTILLAAVLGAGATACGSSHPAPPAKQSPGAVPTTSMPTPLPSTTATSDSRAAVEACATALAAAAPGGATPDVCKTLSVSGYMAAMQASIAAERDKLGKEIASATAKP